MDLLWSHHFFGLGRMKIDLARIFATALARRVAFVIVAALLAALGFSGKAHAATYAYPDQGSAYAGCMAQGASMYPYDLTGGTTERRFADCLLSGSGYFVRYRNCPKGGTGTTGCGQPGSTSEYHSWTAGQTCASRPSQTSTRLPLGGSTQCINGCMYSYALNADDETSTRSTNGAVCNNTKDNCGAGKFYNVLMNVCQPIVPNCKDGEVVKNGVCVRQDDCPEGMVAVQGSTPGAIAAGELYCKPKENECPAGNIKAPSGQCLPGEGQCAAGEAKKKDGTCGKDGNGDGVPDDEDSDEENDTTKETFGGGDSCSAPPSCDGSPILCGQARIQWRIDCNTRRHVNVSGGSCTAVPLCTGENCNAMEYAQLMQQWRSTCALEKLANGAGEGEQGSENQDLIDHLEAQRDAEIAGANANAAQGDGHAGVSESTIFAENTGAQFNPNLFGGGSPGMCSFSTTLELMGQSIELPSEFWTLAAMIGWLTVACAYLWVAFQLG